jgi:hypothetical protein
MKKLLFIAVVAMFMACTHVPECSSPEVVNIAIEGYKEEIRFELAYKKFYKDNFDELENTDGGKLTMQMLALFGAMEGKSMADLQKQLQAEKKQGEKEIRRIVEGKSDYSSKYAKYVVYADSLVNSAAFGLSTIRTTAIEPELQKCNCAAELVSSGATKFKTRTVKYSAQFTDDGTLFVEYEY